MLSQNDLLLALRALSPAAQEVRKRAPDEKSRDDFGMKMGQWAALICHSRGGKSLDGVTFGKGGKLHKWKPDGGPALRGWEWVWAELEKDEVPGGYVEDK